MNTEFKYYKVIIKKYLKAIKQLLKLSQLKIQKCHGLSEAKKIAAYSQDDIEDAVQWLHSVNKRFQDWLRLDGHFMETVLFQACHSIAHYVVAQWRRWRPSGPS